MFLYIFWIVSVLGTGLYSIKHSKELNNQKLILVLLFLFLFILLGWCRGAYDVEIGISRYVNYKRMESFTEIGYNLLVKLFHSFGFGYRPFFVFCSFIELISLFWFTKKNCRKSHIAICLFMIYPFVIYLQYIRTLAAVPFILIAIDALINKEKNYIPKYIIFCLIAASFHFSSIFFLLYLPISFLNKKMTLVLVGIGVIILRMVSSLSFLYDLVERYLGTEKVGILERSINANGTFGRIFAIVISILFFYIMIYILKLIFKVKFEDEKDEIFFKINLMSMICIPLTLNFGVGFARIPTLLFVVNYPYLVDKTSEIQSQKKRVLAYLLMLMYLFALFFVNFHNLEYRQLVLYPFFEKNELINSIFY